MLMATRLSRAVKRAIACIGEVVSIGRGESNKKGALHDGYSAFVEGDYATALQYWLPLAEQGYAKAQTNVGMMYAEALGVSQDYTEALNWYRKSTEQGDPAGYTNLGLLYESGRGVVRDYARAADLHRQAAELGDRAGQNNLGLMYKQGLVSRV